MYRAIQKLKPFMRPDDPPLEYIKRTRRYYQALGYGEPYQWAHYDDVPFTALSKPLGQCRVGLVTTAAPYQLDKGDQGPRAAYNAEAKFYEVYSMNLAGSPAEMPDLRISHVAIDRDHTIADDIGAYFPLKALQEAVRDGKISSVSKRFYGLPTNRSKRKTLEVDCEKLLSLCREDGVDVAVLVPNCPVCHQSTALAARRLEAAGIVTVVMGCAKDIVEYVGVPRFLFNDFPLGNSAGLPHNPASQNTILWLALDLIEQANVPRSTWQSPFRWPGKLGWKEDYSNPDKLSEVELSKKRATFDASKLAAKRIRNRSDD